jgi:bacillopeptidase F
VIADRIAPALVVSAPLDSTITNLKSISVSGTVKDSTTVSVTINGNIVHAVNGSFTSMVVLVEGMNKITVVAADAAGNTSSIVRSVRLYTQPPVCVIQSPNDSLITKTSSIAVSGTVSDSTAVALTINGSSVPVSNGSFNTTVNLAEGTNKIAIVVTDAAGNKTTISRTVIVDRIAPTLVILSPLDSTSVNLSSIIISGTVKDSTAVSVTISGKIVPVFNGSFNTTLALNEGTNKITIAATDAAGNQTTATRIVILNTQALSLNVASLFAYIDETKTGIMK